MTAADVLVAGAGPAGAATAAALAAEGLHVLVLDRAAFPRDKACAEFLSPGAVAALGRLGVLDAAAAAGVWKEGLRIVAAGGELTLRYREGQRGLGISRPVLDDLLLRRAREAGAEVRERTDVAGALLEHGRVCGVRLRDGRELRARFVVAADGLHSPVARSLGLERPARWPRRLGLVARMRGIAPTRSATSASPNATFASSVQMTSVRSGNAQSSSSIRTPSSDFSAGVISSSWRTIGVSGPSIEPEAMRNNKLYPIWPAAPVTATRTGVVMRRA